MMEKWEELGLTEKQFRELQRRARLELARRDFWEFCKLMVPSFYQEERGFLKELCRDWQNFYESETEKVLVINEPPRHGKSLTAQLFSCWVFGKNPQEKIITGSYNEQLSKTFSRNVRDRINERKAEKDKIVYSDIFPKTKIKKGNSAANLWALSGQYASYLATSPGGTVTGFGCSCFPAETTVFTSDGYVNIENIKIGQMVVTYDTESGTLRERPVVAIHVKLADSLRLITTKGFNHAVMCTNEHPFWMEKEGYIRASLIEDGDNLMTLNELPDGSGTVAGWESAKCNIPIEKEYPEQQYVVYDIEVEGEHNFFANGILVHNCMIIDDIVKNAEEAMNETVLEGHYEWFVNTMLSRLEKGGKIIIIATRWATKDLSGRIIEHYNSINVPIRVIVKKALQDDGTMLCPEILDRKSYDLISKTMGQEIVRANYDQKPIDLVGRLYDIGFDAYTKLPTDDKGNSVVEEICAYVDTADQGDDYLCGIIYAVYNHMAYVLDVYYTKDNMSITEPEMAKRLYEHKVTRAYIESNNGGMGYGRSVERILREKYHYYNCFIDLFTQHRNKRARILSNAVNAQRQIKFPVAWDVKYPQFYIDTLAFQKEGKMAHDDNADAITGVVERLGRSLFSFD